MCAVTPRVADFPAVHPDCLESHTHTHTISPSRSAPASFCTGAEGGVSNQGKDHFIMVVIFNFNKIMTFVLFLITEVTRWIHIVVYSCRCKNCPFGSLYDFFCLLRSE